MTSPIRIIKREPRVPRDFLPLSLLDELDDVLVVKDVVTADLLGQVLHRGTPDQRMFKFFDEGAMKLVAEVLNIAVVLLEHHR